MTHSLRWRRLGARKGGFALTLFGVMLAVCGCTILPAPAPGPDEGKGCCAVDTLFADYYSGHDGPRMLGRAISERMDSKQVREESSAQYFQKARLEIHKSSTGLTTVSSPRASGPGDQTAQNQAQQAEIVYGLVVDELQQARMPAPVGGRFSTITYATINDLAVTIVLNILSNHLDPGLSHTFNGK